MKTERVRNVKRVRIIYDNIKYRIKKTYASDSGYDVRAKVIGEQICIKPGQWMLVSLGFRLELPKDTEAVLRPRSGLAKNHGIMILYGTIDQEYTGDVMAIVFNFGDKEFYIKDMDRIGQIVFQKVTRFPIIEECTVEVQEKQDKEGNNKIEDNNVTGRGSRGFGSTGME